MILFKHQNRFRKGNDYEKIQNSYLRNGGGVYNCWECMEDFWGKWQSSISFIGLFTINNSIHYTIFCAAFGIYGMLKNKNIKKFNFSLKDIIMKVKKN